MSTETKQSPDISRLPKWAQDHIKTLQRERDIAVRGLNEWCDNQTPSAFSIDELVCTGEQQGPSSKTRYIQGHRMTVRHGAIRLDISLPLSKNSHPGISLQWSGEHRTETVALIPESYQRVYLVEKKDL